MRREDGTFDKNNPLWKAVMFKRFPCSHSLVLTNVISFIISSLLAVGLGSPDGLPVFVIASVSHWLLDVVVRRTSRYSGSMRIERSDLGYGDGGRLPSW